MEQEALSPDVPPVSSMLCKFMQQNVTVSATLDAMLMQITLSNVLEFRRNPRSKMLYDKQDLQKILRDIDSYIGNDV